MQVMLDLTEKDVVSLLILMDNEKEKYLTEHLGCQEEAKTHDIFKMYTRVIGGLENSLGNVIDKIIRR